MVCKKYWFQDYVVFQAIGYITNLPNQTTCLLQDFCLATGQWDYSVVIIYTSYEKHWQTLLGCQWSWELLKHCHSWQKMIYWLHYSTWYEGRKLHVVTRNQSLTRLLGHPQPQMYPPVGLNQYTLVNKTHIIYIYVYAYQGSANILK